MAMAKAGARSARTTGGARDRSAATRAALVQAAIETLREAGFAGCSAREVAQRAGCNQALVFYHFGSVSGLLLAALDDVSERRMAAYRPLIEGHGASLPGLAAAAREIFAEDLAAGHVKVLVELIAGAPSVPGMGEQVAERLAPWRELAEAAVRGAVGQSPLATLAPVKEIAHGLVAGFLGPEMLAELDGSPAAALALFDRFAALAALIDQAGLLGQQGLMVLLARALTSREGEGRR